MVKRISLLERFTLHILLILLAHPDLSNRVFPDDPIEKKIMLKVIGLHDVLKQSTKVRVVRFLFKLKLGSIREVLDELIRALAAELFGGRLKFSIPDHFILLLFAFGSDVRPWQGALQQINQDVAKSEEIVSATLLVPKVGVE